MITIEAEPADAAPAREALLDRAFGRGRLAKTAERLREGRLPVPGLSLVARDDGRLVGTIRFWNLRAGDCEALLLGPVAVAASHRGRGLGAALIRRGLSRARAQGHAAVILVGDEPYYRRFGFRAGLTRRLVLPGPVDRRRFLGLELTAGAFAFAAGPVRAAGAVDGGWRRRAA